MEEMAHVSFDSLEIPATAETHDGLPAGIRALMMAVLEDAINSLTSSVVRVRSEAVRWIMSRECQHVFSYAVICETLDLNPSAARRSIMGMLDKQQTSGRLLKRNRPNVRRSGTIQLRTHRPRLSRHPAAAAFS